MTIALIFEGVASRWFIASCALVGLVLATSIFALGGLYNRLQKPVTWKEVHARIAREFPGIRQIPTAELAGRMAEQDPARPLPLLVDCRSPEEFAVGHLPGAVNLRTVEEVSRLAGRDREIVTYCSVGLRSSGFASELYAAGFSGVGNLEGSIFQWANEGRVLVDSDGAPTTEVHPFNERWGVLLEKVRE